MVSLQIPTLQCDERFDQQNKLGGKTAIPGCAGSVQIPVRIPDRLFGNTGISIGDAIPGKLPSDNNYHNAMSKRNGGMKFTIGKNGLTRMCRVCADPGMVIRCVIRWKLDKCIGVQMSVLSKMGGRTIMIGQNG